MYLNPDHKEIVPSAPLLELLDPLMKQGSYNRSEISDSDHKKESSSLSLTNSNTRRQKHNDRVQEKIKGLRRMVTSLLHRLTIQDSCQKSNILSKVIAGLDP